MKQKKFDEALVLLKEKVKNLRIRRGTEHSWSKIPNAELDPYYIEG